MKYIKTKKGFSLLELSLVLLVIGILVAGITKGRKILADAKIASAQTLTNASPVNGIRGLVVWLETSSDKSFDEDNAENNTPILRWHNLSSQNATTAFVEPTTGSGFRPYYISSGINNLPSIRFGTNPNNNAALNSAMILSSPAIISSDKLYVFVVCRRRAFVANATAVSFASSGSDVNDQSFNFARETTATNIQTFRNTTGLSSQTHPGNGVPYVMGTSFDGAVNMLYLNGLAINSPASTGAFNIDTIILGSRFTTGANDAPYYDGDISELIIFNKKLTNMERRSVAQYLSQKYSIRNIWDANL